MADPFGIIGVIGVAGQIIQVAVQFGQDWKGAPADAKSFVAELQVLKTVLSETHTNTLLNPDFCDAFQGRHSALLRAQAQGADTQVMVSVCREGLESFLLDLKKRLQGNRVGWERLKGAFLAKRTREAMEDLHRQCLSLNSLVAIDTLALAVSTHRQVKEGNEQQQQMHCTLNQLNDRHGSREATIERDTILDWLSQVDYASQQHDFITRRQAGTGQWLLDSEEFKKWVEADEQTLFCPGIPGAGKTILASIVVDYLTNRFGADESIGIAYLYLSFKRRDGQKPDELLASLLKQLAQARPFLPDCVKYLYNNQKQGPSLDTLLQSLRSVASLYKKCFIIVDALDECESRNGYRDRFLSAVLGLQTLSGLSIFTTSRIIPEIAERFRGSNRIEIRASEDDVKRYVDGHMSLLPSFVKQNAELQEEIRIGIHHSVDGMFLLAQLHLASLAGKRSPTAIRKALAILPTGSGAYDAAYKEAMERIEGQLKDQEELAKQVLAWITYAERPLTTTELREALAVEVGDSELDEDNRPQIEDMVSVCAGLVTVDEESDVIRLVHYTTQEYFERTRDEWFPEAEVHITSICVTYLSFSTFESGPCQENNDFEDRLGLYPLYDYAARNWGRHARRVMAPTQLMTDFLTSDAKVQASSQVLYSDRLGIQNWFLIPSNMTGLHLVSQFGILNMAQLLLSYKRLAPCYNNLNSKDSLNRTPLSIAVENEHAAVARLLLENGAEVDPRDRSHETPLTKAAWNGHMDVVQLLLENGAHIESKEVNGKTPLACAAMQGHAGIVQMLLNNGASVESTDNDNQTPLAAAATNEHIEVVQLLLDRGANIESKDLDGYTLLHKTAWNRDVGVMQLLLRHGADVIVNAKERYHQTPLIKASVHGHAGLVQLLLENGAEIESEDREGHTPVAKAARYGHVMVVQLLLEHGANIEVKDNLGKTPVAKAARYGHVTVVQLLLENGANIESKDYLGQTPLACAARFGHVTIVQLLLENGANLESKDNSDQTPLACAARFGHMEIVQLLSVRNKALGNSADTIS